MFYVRVKLTFTSVDHKQTIEIPIHYNYLLQSFIYKSLSASVATKLHNKGYKYEKRKFKLFTFSKIFCDSLCKKKEYFSVTCPFYFYFSSADENITKNLALNLLKNDIGYLQSNKIKVVSVEFCSSPQFTKAVTIKLISPITIYSTFKKEDGTKKTYFYNPMEKEFVKLLKSNSLKKYELVNGSKYTGNFNIEPLKFSIKRNFHILKYKGTVIHGYSGIYKLEAEEDMIKTLYLCGLGSKNSQGFGMFELIT
jgi:CRISPR-associated endoribonuclease Cas6